MFQEKWVLAPTARNETDEKESVLSFRSQPPRPNRKKTYPHRLAVPAFRSSASGPFLVWLSERRLVPFALASPRVKRNGPRGQAEAVPDRSAPPAVGVPDCSKIFHRTMVPRTLS
jgi:hypothetical protein